MKTTIKRKKLYLDQDQLDRARKILDVKTEAQAIRAASDLVILREEIIDSLKKVARKGGVEKVF